MNLETLRNLAPVLEQFDFLLSVESRDCVKPINTALPLIYCVRGHSFRIFFEITIYISNFEIVFNIKN